MHVFRNKSETLSAVLMTVLAFVCVPGSRADVILPAGQGFSIGDPVPERTFSDGSLELLIRLDRTFAIHGLELVGSWDGSITPDSHSPVGLSAGDLLAEVCSPGGRLLEQGYVWHYFARVHADVWEQAGSGIDRRIDQPLDAMPWLLAQDPGEDTDESAQLASELKNYSVEVTAGLAVVSD